MKDLVASRDPAWPFRFDEAKAGRACEFIEGLPHVKGSWAAESEDLRLQPWQCFIVCSLFGWVKKSDGFRRFRIAYICVPRKNGKSTLAAGIGVFMFAADGEFGSEIYSGATTEKQAWEVFRPAKQMVERTADLKEAFGIETGVAGSNARVMSILANGSRFEPVIGKPGDGASPHCAIVDEYHEHDSDSLLDTMRTGMMARKQPLLLVITTAGSNLAGPCKAMQGDVEQVLMGSLDRQELFGCIWTVDEGTDWTVEDALKMANPNYDVSAFGETLRSEQVNAIADARKQAVFKTKHLNIWVGANSAFLNLEEWNRLADPSLDPDQFRGLLCVAGADLASKKDIASRVIVFKKNLSGVDHYYVFGRHYLPADRAARPEFQHYQAWAIKGALLTTPGPVLDFDKFTDDTIADCQQFKIRELAFDPANAEHYAQTVAKRTTTVAAEIPQMVAYMSEPMKQLDALITAGRIHHDGNPCMTWMIGNLTAHTDAKEQVFPRKERDENKIDGAVALIMALSRATVIGAKSASVYSTRGIRLL